MELKVNVPSNLDLNEVFKQHLTTSLPSQQYIDFMYYICHQLVHIMASHRGEKPQYNDYFPLCSARFKQLHHNYSAILNHLLDANVLITDRRFIVGEKCRGYRFAHTYTGQPLKTLTLNNNVLSRNVKRQDKIAEEHAKSRLVGYDHLTRWYLDPGLEIDKARALAWVDNYLADKMVFDSSLSSEEIEVEAKKIIDTCEGYKLIIEFIAAGNWGYKNIVVDEFAGRLHAPLTWLKKELRSFLTYKGQKLVNIDIKNCQPYLVTVLLDPVFWSPVPESGSSIIRLQEINPSLYYELSNYPTYSTCIILPLLENLPRHASRANQYKQLVCSGTFYEYFQKELLKGLPTDHSHKFQSRDKVKKAVLTLLNCENQLSEHYTSSRLFAHLFPEIDNIISFIKTVDNAYLACVLQRVESHTVLKEICKEIANERPQLPLFTIHDCIVTTVGNEEYVKEKVLKIMGDRVGIPPQVKFEYF